MTATISHSLPRLQDGIDDVLRHAVPEGICRTFRVMPYAHHQGTVLVAAADADDSITEHVVAERLDRPVVLVRHTASEITEVVDEAYPRVAAEVESAESRRTRMQMTQMLTRSGLVSSEQLQRAMLEYARTGDPLGDILVSHESIAEDVLVAALSEMHQIQRVGLTDFEPDYTVARRLPERLARTLRALPVIESEGIVMLAVARPLAGEDAVAVEEALGRPFRQLLANRTDLDQLLQRVHTTRYAEVAVHDLVTRFPEQSAHVVVSPAQKAVLLVAAVVLTVGAVVWPTGTAVGVVALCSALYLVVAAYRVRLTMRALGTHLETDVTDEEVVALDERTLPDLHDPGAALPRGRRSCRAWSATSTRSTTRAPASTCMLLCEEDDAETIEAIRRRSPCRRTSSSWSCPTASRRPSRRPATTACSWPPAPTASSTTPRTGPTPTS